MKNICNKLPLGVVIAMLSFSTLQAQVKVGSNPTVITSNAKLEVEGSTGVKSVFMDNGNVGIGGTPSSRFHVHGGGSILSNGATPTVPLSNAYNDISADEGTTDANILRIVNTSAAAVGNKAMLGFNTYNGGGATWGIGSIQTAITGTSNGASGVNQNDFWIGNSTGGGYIERFRVLTNGHVGIGTNAPTNTLDVNGSARIRTMGTTPAANDAVVFVDADGTLKKLTISQLAALGFRTKTFVNPSSGATSGNIPCSAGFDIINYDAWDGNYAPTITLPNCGTPGQKIVVRSAASFAATISTANTFAMGEGTWTVQTGDVYEFMFINNKWQLTASPTKEYGFCQAPNNSSSTLLTPTTPKTIMVFWDGCWTSTVTLPAGGTVGDVYIINDLASFALTISSTNTTMGSNLTLNAGSFVQFVKTTQGWTRDL